LGRRVRGDGDWYIGQIRNCKICALHSIIYDQFRGIMSQAIHKIRVVKIRNRFKILVFDPEGGVHLKT
jgi:hypothetical protein